MMGTEPWDDIPQNPGELKSFRVSEERYIAMPSKESKRRSTSLLIVEAGSPKEVNSAHCSQGLFCV